jgi:hypothetical protein
LPAIAVAFAALLAMAFSVSPAASLVGQYLRYESAVVRVGYLLLLGVTASGSPVAWLGRTATSATQRY